MHANHCLTQLVRLEILFLNKFECYNKCFPQIGLNGGSHCGEEKKSFGNIGLGLR